jgi:hypothetical protein
MKSRVLIATLATACLPLLHADEAPAGNSVIIGDRNAKCLRVLGEQVNGGKKELGIFYGAAHYPDMENRLLKEGYKKTGQEWIPAWDIPKPKAPPADEQPDKKAA